MQIKRWATSLASGLLTACALEACSAGSDVVFHSFEFDALRDSPGIQILDHRYGSSKFPGARNVESDQPQQRAGITGEMTRPDSLYVKWRVVAENKVYEDTVDLRKRLPQSITDCTILFVVRGAQLYVYLVLPERRPAVFPPNGPRRFEDRKVTTIYPDEPKQ
jgi:hypothetical protein